jgi:uncharacterized protein YdeI (YjbR/CyaY-like superfamily)
MNPKVDAFIDRAEQWHDEFEKLREIILDCGLTEELKWGQPCYTLGKNNVVLMHGFKDYCALLFHKGALLSDPKGILIQQTKNVQSARQIRFTNIKEINKLAPTLRSYIREAMEKADMKVELKKTSQFEVAEEFRSKLKKNAALKNAFEALTPGRQRAYLLHFSQPKQSKTRESRVERSIPQILEGKGLDD